MENAHRAAPAIRLATPADYLTWLDLWRGYQTFYKVSIDEPTTAMTWQRLTPRLSSVPTSLTGSSSSTCSVDCSLRSRTRDTVLSADALSPVAVDLCIRRGLGRSGGRQDAFGNTSVLRTLGVK